MIMLHLRNLQRLTIDSRKFIKRLSSSLILLLHYPQEHGLQSRLQFCFLAICLRSFTIMTLSWLHKREIGPLKLATLAENKPHEK